MLEQLYSIVNTRYEDGRAVLVTTNLITREGDDGLREQIGDRTVSRLWEICGEPMHMYGDDQRRVTYRLPARGPGGGAGHRRGRWDEDDPPPYGQPRPRRRAGWAS